MPAGYPRLASLMGAHPEMATFRRFGSLNALNLLYLQAELVDLENKLLKQAKTDAESGHFEPSIYHRDWQTLSESMTTEDGNPTQWHTMLEVRDKLKEYSESIESFAVASGLWAEKLPLRPSHLLAASYGEVWAAERTRFQVSPNMDENAINGQYISPWCRQLTCGKNSMLQSSCASSRIRPTV